MLDQPDWLVAAKRRPRFRGVLHQYAFFVSLVLGALLVVGADEGVARVSALVFAASVAAMLGVSALYHRVVWSPGPRRWMRRLDHAAIFLLIAGTYAPFGLVALDGAWRVVVLAIAWTGASGGDRPQGRLDRRATLGRCARRVCLGWVGISAVPEIYGSVGAHRWRCSRSAASSTRRAR